MRHRITNVHTGLGNPEKEHFDNVWSKNKKLNDFMKEMFEEAIPLYFKDWGGCDFAVTELNGKLCIAFGIEPAYIEPAYKFQHLKMICLSTNKEESFYRQGIAWGYYGSDIAANTKTYADYKKKCKFTRFIDKWHEKLMEVVGNAE